MNEQSSRGAFTVTVDSPSGGIVLDVRRLAIHGGPGVRTTVFLKGCPLPRFVVPDEPTSALAVSVQGKIIKLLTRLGEEVNLTYLFITHVLSLMRNVATRVAILHFGKLCEIAPAAKFFRSPMHPYTKMLLSSIPVAIDIEETLKPKNILSQGEIPSQVNVAPDCSLHLRCPEKMPICSQTDPEMRRLDDGEVVRCHLLPSRSEGHDE